MDWRDLPWQDFTDQVPDDGELILGLFEGVRVIECHAQMDGFYTRDDELITDASGRAAIPDGWMRIERRRAQH